MRNWYELTDQDPSVPTLGAFLTLEECSDRYRVSAFQHSTRPRTATVRLHITYAC